jgi:RimJ/RimL family protein N-acetyltransferase
VITTDRLVLAPLRQADADAMAEVLGDERLHEFIGGRPATRDELLARYGKLEAGSPYPDQRWLNWIVRERDGDRPVGTVQATVVDGATAEIAWVIGVPWQGRGYATEASRAVLDWLRGQGVRVITANVHPDHHGSAKVAERIGLAVTDELVDGERVWRRATPAPPG